ncbi:MAG: ATP-binding cassette domain-containing protein, partial [Synergistaceae bacterium]|nr:ATP-binding cassette domain-containing protein [Synergistaceae bacterium]
MLTLDDVRSSYGRTEALHGISLTAKRGEITTLIGANGSGKTTTMHAVMGVVRLGAGSIEWNGKRLDSLETKEIVRSGIALIPEGRHIFPDMTVAENLEMGAYIRTDAKKQRADMEGVLHLFPKLRERLYQTAGTLSGGEQQML